MPHRISGIGHRTWREKPTRKAKIPHEGQQPGQKIQTPWGSLARCSILRKGDDENARRVSVLSGASDKAAEGLSFRNAKLEVVDWRHNHRPYAPRMHQLDSVLLFVPHRRKLKPIASHTYSNNVLRGGQVGSGTPLQKRNTKLNLHWFAATGFQATYHTYASASQTLQYAPGAEYSNDIVRPQVVSPPSPYEVDWLSNM